MHTYNCSQHPPIQRLLYILHDMHTPDTARTPRAGTLVATNERTDTPSASLRLWLAIYMGVAELIGGNRGR